MASLLTWPSFQMLSCQQGFLQWDAIAKLKPQEYRWNFCAHHWAISPFLIVWHPLELELCITNHQSACLRAILPPREEPQPALSHDNREGRAWFVFVRWHRIQIQYKQSAEAIIRTALCLHLLGSAACGFTVSAQACILLNINRQEKGHRGIFSKTTIVKDDMID
jgi:hypothetical protein